MNEHLVEAGPYKGCLMIIKGGQIIYTPAPKTQDPVPMKLATGLARPDSPINKCKTGECEILECIEECDESEDDAIGLEKLLTHPGLSVITRNKLMKHLDESTVHPNLLVQYYDVVVDALLKKKTFKASIELGEKTLK